MEITERAPVKHQERGHQTRLGSTGKGTCSSSSQHVGTKEIEMDAETQLEMPRCLMGKSNKMRAHRVLGGHSLVLLGQLRKLWDQSDFWRLKKKKKSYFLMVLEAGRLRSKCQKTDPGFF